ncbi:endonuclease domain-containing protein [Arthrobacter sp. MPF02]|uniref:endonuclease domain-containing protein n=1 Tax=Arthrobacter sp. MPF02 TaxID=3388492 RepID=UPI003984B3C1
MKVPRPLPEPFASLPFTLQEAADAGISQRRLRHQGLGRPSRGLRVPTPTDESALGQQIRPYTQVTEFAAASHASAFLLWQFPGFLPGSDLPLLHISRPDAVAIMRRPGVKGHRGQFFADEITTLHGLLITTRVRTWLDCARLMSIDEITVVADHLLRIPRPELEDRSEPFATMDVLEDMLDRHKGTPGIRKARLALEQARVGADSAPETRLRLALAYAGLPEPELNAPTVLGPGVVRQPDLSYPEQKVAVEYDGEVHSDPARIIRDITREEDYARAGWLMVRISKLHMEDEAKGGVRKVRRALRSRGWAAGWKEK